MCALIFKTSHHPHGRLTFCSLFAGRRCLCQFWHSDLVIVHHHWQHSLQCACSRSKIPITPMGFSHVLRVCSQGGGVAVWGGTVTFSSCTITGNTAAYVRAQKFPSPRWEFLADMQFDSRRSNPVSPQGDVCAHAQNFPLPRWDFHMFCAYACRAAVFTSEAR